MGDKFNETQRKRSYVGHNKEKHHQSFNRIASLLSNNSFLGLIVFVMFLCAILLMIVCAYFFEKK